MSYPESELPFEIPEVRKVEPNGEAGFWVDRPMAGTGYSILAFEAPPDFKSRPASQIRVSGEDLLESRERGPLTIEVTGNLGRRILASRGYSPRQ